MKSTEAMPSRLWTVLALLAELPRPVQLGEEEPIPIPSLSSSALLTALGVAGSTV